MSWSRDKDNRSCRQRLLAKQQIDETIRQAYCHLRANGQCTKAFSALLIAVREMTDMLCPAPDHYRWSDACLYVNGLMNLASNYQSFVRPIRDWQPSQGSQRRIFTSLVEHLLMQYLTPPFMISAWLGPSSQAAWQKQMWHIGMGRGFSIRRLDVPIHMTRRMENLFLKAPHHFTIEQAFRYSQILGMGGDRHLAAAIIATRMGTDLENDDFWASVVRFFINASNMKPSQVNPIVDFLYHAKFAKREVIAENRAIILNPPYPDFSMKGRSLNSIIRMVEKWHGDIAECKDNAGLSWPRSSIRDFAYLEEFLDSEGNRRQRIWTISQLLYGAQLTEEGRAMGHCAGIYSLACFKGLTTVWSMKMESCQNVRRILTIEVEPIGRLIRQARAKHNRMPDDRSLDILKRWAAKEGLKIAQHI
jgi:hypothetical protein